jgi:hypothetical protein
MYLSDFLDEINIKIHELWVKQITLYAVNQTHPISWRFEWNKKTNISTIRGNSSCPTAFELWYWFFFFFWFICCHSCFYFLSLFTFLLCLDIKHKIASPCHFKCAVQWYYRESYCSLTLTTTHFLNYFHLV